MALKPTDNLVAVSKQRGALLRPMCGRPVAPPLLCVCTRVSR
jgi:hypothetical protein